MSMRLKLSIACALLGTALAVPCLYHTTSLSMMAFFSLGLPAYGAGMVLYVWEVLADLRSHDVL